MSRTVIFSTETSPHVGRIEFSEAMGARSRGDFKCIATFALDDQEWSAQLDMISAYRADMLGFFEEIGAEAAGWDGVKEWRSEFDEMGVRATNPGEGVVILDVWIDPSGDDWERSGTIHVRAAELPRFAERIGSFLRMPEGGERFTR